MQSETGFPSSHQLKPYVASKSRMKLAARAVLSEDAGLLVILLAILCSKTFLADLAALLALLACFYNSILLCQMGVLFMTILMFLSTFFTICFFLRICL